MKKMNIGEFAKTLKSGVGRFPLVIGFVVMLTILLMCDAWCGAFELTWKVDGSLYYFAASGIWISMFFYVMMEEVKKKWVNIAFGVAIALLAADSIRFFCLPGSYMTMYGTEVLLARMSIFVSSVLLMLVLPSLKKRDDIESINFSLSLFRNGVQSVLVSMIASAGWIALFWGTTSLFGINVDGWKELVELWPLIVVAMTVPLVVFVCRMPMEEDRHKETFEPSKFYKGVLLGLIIPLVVCFMLVLYFYLLKIIVEWSLPKGGVVWMVSSMMVGVIVVSVMLNPLIHNGGTAFQKKVVRYLPMLSLPLVVLMSVAIGRRLADYGVSINRLYIVAFCVYCFIVLIGLIINKGKRVNFILIAFGVIFLLTSAQPMNIVNVTMSIMHKKLSDKIAQYPPEKLPLDNGNMYGWLNSLPDSSGREIASVINELKSNKGSCFDTTLVARDVHVSHYEYETGLDNPDYIYSEEADTLIYVEQSQDALRVPQGYKFMNEYYLRRTDAKDSLLVDGEIILYSKQDKLRMNVAELLEKRPTSFDAEKTCTIEGITDSGQKVILVLDDSELLLIESRGKCEISGHFWIFHNGDFDMNDYVENYRRVEDIVNLSL